MIKNIWTNFCASVRNAWDDLCAICIIFCKGRTRYLDNLEVLRDHKNLVAFSSEILNVFNFPDERKHLGEIIPIIEKMIKSNAASVKIRQENDMLLNQLKQEASLTEKHIAEFIAELDNNTGLLNMLEEISRCDPNQVTIESRELQPLLYEVFNRFTARGLKRILNNEDVGTLSPQPREDVKIIGENIDLGKDKFILANKGWKYNESIIAEAVLRKRG